MQCVGGGWWWWWCVTVCVGVGGVAGVFTTAGDQDYDNNISSGTAVFRLLSQADHISRMPHAVGGFPHGHPCLPS